MTTQRRHITTSTTTAVIDHSVYVVGIIVSVTNGGSTWKLSIQDRASPPMALIPPVTLSPPNDITAKAVDLTNIPAYMQGGIDIVTAGTPGVVDVWLLIADKAQA